MCKASVMIFHKVGSIIKQHICSCECHLPITKGDSLSCQAPEVGTLSSKSNSICTSPEPWLNPSACNMSFSVGSYSVFDTSTTYTVQFRSTSHSAHKQGWPSTGTTQKIKLIKNQLNHISRSELINAGYQQEVHWKVERWN